MAQRVGGWWALVAVWALTVVPAALCVYIVRNVFTERWPGTPLTAVMEGPAVALALWVLASAALTVWGVAATPARRGQAGAE